MPSFEMLRRLWVDQGRITFREEDWKCLSARAVERVRTNLWSIGNGVLGLPQRVWPEARDYGLEELVCVIREFLRQTRCPAAPSSPPYSSPIPAPVPMAPPSSIIHNDQDLPSSRLTPPPSPLPASSTMASPRCITTEPPVGELATCSAGLVVEDTQEEHFVFTFMAFAQQCLIPAFEDMRWMYKKQEVIFLEDHWRQLVEQAVEKTQDMLRAICCEIFGFEESAWPGACAFGVSELKSLISFKIPAHLAPPSLPSSDTVTLPLSSTLTSLSVGCGLVAESMPTTDFVDDGELGSVPLNTDATFHKDSSMNVSTTTAFLEGGDRLNSVNVVMEYCALPPTQPRFSQPSPACLGPLLGLVCQYLWFAQADCLVLPFDIIPRLQPPPEPPPLVHSV
jgi:hypothetical protein